MEHEERSKILPTDPFDIALHEKMGLTNGAHSHQHTVQTIDPYGNSTTHIVQTVKTEIGEWVFLQQADAQGLRRFILPPKVLALIDRQRDYTVTLVRRRHGRRLAEERGNPFTPEMRAKARETRRRNAARKRKARP
jgi:hypothetical protein